MAVFNKSKDYNRLKKKISVANKRIKRIEKRYGDRSWAINQLYDKINVEHIKGINKRGQIRVTKRMSSTQLKAIEKATAEFMKSETSKLTGISNAIRRTKRALKASFGDMNRPLSTKEINKLYDLVEDKNKRTITEQIGASTLWGETKRAKDKNLSFEKYVKNVDKRGQIDIKDKNDLMFLKDLFKDYTGRDISEEEISNIMNNLKIK